MEELEKYREALLNTYLGLSTETAHLRDIAYAKVILWVLFIEENKYLTTREIAEKGAQLMQVASLPTASIESAVAILNSRRFITKKDLGWGLVPMERTSIEKTFKHSEEVTEEILKKHFPQKIEADALRQWFNEANKVYFGTQSQNLLSLYNDGKPPIHHLEEVIKPVIKKYKLEKFEDDLIQGYREFLTSDDREDTERIFKFMSSLLSMKIVSAEIAPEAFSLDRYKKVDVILDTNVLFGMTMYKDDATDNALKALGRAASFLEINFFIADVTVEEYEAVRARERNSFITLWTTYSLEIIESMDRKDGFTRGLLKAGCRNVEDVKRFFDVGLNIPDKLGDVPINFLTGKDTKGSEFNEAGDKSLFENIQSITEEFRGRKKSDGPARHDVRLWKLAVERNKSKDAFVLTVDQPMTTFAIRQAAPKSEPLWQNLLGLVQVLALNGGGAEFDASDLAPLFRTFADFEDVTGKEKYDKRDLLLLTEKTERIKDLPESKIKSTLQGIHKARLSNNTAMMYDEVIELERFLRQKDSLRDQTIREQDSKISDLTSSLSTTAMKAKQQKKTIAWLWLSLKAAGAIFLSYILFSYLWDVVVNDHKIGNKFELVQTILQIAAPGLYIGREFFKTLKEIKAIDDDKQV